MLQARPNWFRENEKNQTIGRIQINNGYAIVDRQFDKQFLIKQGFKDITPPEFKNIIKEDPKSILIIRAGGFGDILMALPVIEELKRRYPKVPIDVQMDLHHFEVIKEHPAIRKCINTFPQYIGMEVEKYDMVIDFSTIIPNNPEAEYKNAYELHYDWAELPQPSTIAGYIPRLEIDAEFSLKVFEDFKKFGLQKDKDYIIINLMATSSVRQYPFIHAREIAIKLGNKYPEKQILFCGAQPFEHLKYRVMYKCKKCKNEAYIGLLDPPIKKGTVKCDKCGDSVHVYPSTDISSHDEKENYVKWFKYPPNVFFLNTTLKQFIVLLNHAELLISTDSAPLHIAGILQVPSLGLFSSFDAYTRVGKFPYIEAIQAPFRCAPCFQHSLTCSTAMRDGNIFAPCMNSIKPDDVIKRSERIIEKGITIPIKQSVIPVKKTSCPICKSDKSELRLRKGEHYYFTCIKCDSLYIYPPPPTKKIQEIYSDPTYNDVFRNYEYVKNSCTEWAKQVTEKIHSMDTALSGKKMLEIGCNIGYFGLEAIKQGWEYTGIDLSQDAIEEAKKKGLEKQVICGNIFKKEVFNVVKHRGGKNGFDVLVLHQTLEHMADPIDFVKFLLPLLHTGGWLSITMPDLTQWIGDSEWPHLNAHHAGEHITLFSQDTMKVLAKTLNLNIKLTTSLPSSYDFWTLLQKKGI